MSKQAIVTFNPNDGQGGAGDGSNRAAIMLEKPFKLSAGLKPDINTALIPYAEFLNIPDITQTGTIELWWSESPADGEEDDDSGGTPDVSIEDISIYDVDMAESGTPPDLDSPIITVYRVQLADWRARLVAPRGGRLEMGLLNPDVSQIGAGMAPDITSDDTGMSSDSGSDAGDDGTSDDGGDDEDDTSDADSNTLIPNSQLILFCLNAMGLPDVNVPATVDLIDPPKNLRWFGNHAPTELEKLLLHCGHVFVPTLDGSGEIYQLGQTNEQGGPTILAKQLLIDVDVPAIDRRGKTVIFTSYPYSNVVTQNVPGPMNVTGGVTLPAPPSWVFVAQDSDNLWKRIDTLDCCSDPVAFVQNGCQWNSAGSAPGGVTTQDDATRLQNQLYYCIRFESNDYNPSPSPILHRVIESDYGAEIVVYANHAVIGTTGTIANAWANIKVLHRIELGVNQNGTNQNGILFLAERLGQVSNGASDLNAGFVVPAANSFIVRISQEDVSQTTDAKGNTLWQPQYFRVGFSQAAGAGSPTPISDADVQNAISGSTDKDTIIISRPQWVLKRIAPSPVSTVGQAPTFPPDAPPAATDAGNYNDLVAAATKEAGNFLKGSGAQPHITKGSGFITGAIDGATCSIEWDQKEVTTAFKINKWFCPAEGLIDLRHHSKGDVGAEYPNAVLAAPARASLGMVGSTAPVTPISPPAPGQNGTLPSGENQYMLFQMVSNNQTGWDYLMAGPMN